MRRQLLPALRMLLALTVVCGLAYPLVMTGFAQVVFPDQANGSLVKVDGKVVGSRLMGQEFTGPEWFHSRPSAAGVGASGSMVAKTDDGGNEILGADGQAIMVPADISDASNNASGFSSLGPTNPVLIKAVTERAAAYRAENGLAKAAQVPVDAVTTSGSGVDPQISVANARIQAVRVAKTRGLSEADVLKMVDTNTTGRSFGFLGEPGVNVLMLNVAVDAAARP